MEANTTKQGLATYSEVEEYLSVSRNTLLRIINEGLLRVVYVKAKSPRIEWAEVENFIATRRQS